MDRLVRIFQKLIAGIVLISVGLILAEAAFAYLYKDKLPITYKSSLSCKALFCLLIALLFVFALAMFRRIDAYGKKALILFSLSAVLFSFMIFLFLLANHISSIQVTDSARLMDQAIYFAKEGIGPEHILPLYQTYFGQYSNNYFFTLLLAGFYRLLFLLGIKDVLLPSYLLNILAVYLCILFSVLTAIRLRGYRSGAKVLLLSVLNPTFYLMVFWIYTNILSLPFMTGALYFGICLYQSHKSRGRVLLFGIAEGIIVALGYYIRATVLIPVIALLLCYALLLLRKKGHLRQLLHGFVAFVLAFAILFQGIKSLNIAAFGDNSDQNFPATHWIMMSTHGNGALDLDDVDYTRSFATKEEKVQANLRVIRENIVQNGPKGLAVLFLKKLYKTWADGYGSLNARIGQSEHFTSLHRYLLGDRKDFFVLYCFAYYIFVYMFLLFTCFSFLRSKKENSYLFLLLLTFFGGIAFYSIWEAKNVYSVPFFPIIILAAESGGTCLSARLKKREDIPRAAYLGVFGVYAAGLLILCIHLYPFLAEYPVSQQIYTINCATPRNVTYIKEAAKEDAEILQSFHLGTSPIDHIDFYVKYDPDMETADEGTGYEVRLLDSSQNLLRTMTVGKEDIYKDHYITVEFDPIFPEGTDTLVYLQIQKNGVETAPFLFGHLNRRIDVYRGDCYVDQTLQDYDLYVRIYRQDRQPLFQTPNACLICAALWLLSVGILLLFFRTYRIRLARKKQQISP